ncbi:hypothetical protein F5050DRAFT_939166 [Lentinula boryana]|uniref:F-box domain-containing protein n=1 Tax=Lentinula boryana TaxID=40481 RepID=A0ABQ8Q3H0_9AGAR|nr:hypothetical protein F5050DRAFT_939166 [Lentinula boryana]
MPFVTSNSPQEMANRFPLEIYELFIDELSGSREFLQSSSLVSYAWLFRCRTHLFRRFRLRYVPPSGDVGDKDYLYCWYPTKPLHLNVSDAGAEGLCPLVELLKVQQIRQSIRELSFIEGDVIDSSRYMMHSFGKSLFELAASMAFPKLHSLDISFRASGPRDCCPGVITMQEIMRINPTLERLCVSSLYLDNHCLQTFLRSFRLCSRLSTIQLRCITYTTHAKSSLSLCSSVASEMDTVKLHRTFRPTIRTLSLSDVNPDLVEVLFSPAKPDVFKMADLNSLAIDCSDLEGKYRTLEKNKGFRIIERHASSLQHLLLLKYPRNIDHAVYRALFSTTLPHLSTLEMHFVNVHDGSFRHVLEKLSSLHSPLSEFHIGLKYGPRTALTPPVDRSITKFAQSLRSLRRVRFQVTQMIDEFRCEHLPQAALILQLEIVQVEGM